MSKEAYRKNLNTDSKPNREPATKHQANDAAGSPVDAQFEDFEKNLDTFDNAMKEVARAQAKIRKNVQTLRSDMQRHEERLEALEKSCAERYAATATATATAAAATPPASEAQVDNTTTAAPVEEPKRTSSATTPVKNGVGYAYKYWQSDIGQWSVKTDLWAAKQAGNGVYEIVWAWYIDGEFDHVLSPDEVRKYAP